MTKEPVQKVAIAATLCQGQAKRAFTAYVNKNAKTAKHKTDANVKKSIESHDNNSVSHKGALSPQALAAPSLQEIINNANNGQVVELPQHVVA